MENVNVILKDRKITKDRLAKRMGMSRENLYRILKGNPTLDNLKKLATALDIPVWQLFTSSSAAGSESVLNGFVEHKGKIHKVQSKEDLQNLLTLIE